MDHGQNPILLESRVNPKHIYAYISHNGDLAESEICYYSESFICKSLPVVSFRSDLTPFCSFFIVLEEKEELYPQRFIEVLVREEYYLILGILKEIVYLLTIGSEQI